MARILQRIIAGVLTGCLIADPVAASAAPFSSRSTQTSIGRGNRFTDQALAARARLSGRRVIEHLVPGGLRAFWDFWNSWEVVGVGRTADGPGLGTLPQLRRKTLINPVHFMEDSGPSSSAMRLGDQIQTIRQTPQTAHKLQLLMNPKAPLRQFMSEVQFAALENALKESERGGKVDDILPVVDAVLWNATFHLANKAGTPLALHHRLSGLSQSARRIISKVVFKKNNPVAIGEKTWREFVAMAVDPAQWDIHPDVKSALLEYFDNFIRTKQDFGNYQPNRPILGRASATQIRALNRLTERGFQEITSLLQTLAAEGYLTAESVSVTQQEELLASYKGENEDISAKGWKEAEIQQAVQNAAAMRMEIVEQLRELWTEGFVPYPKWLEQHHPILWSKIKRRRTFNNDFDAAYRAAGIPYALKGRAHAGGGLFFKPRYAEQMQAGEYRIANYSPAELNAALRANGGNWLHAVRNITGKLVAMESLENVELEQIERIAFEAGGLTAQSRMDRTERRSLEWKNDVSPQPSPSTDFNQEPPLAQMGPLAVGLLFGGIGAAIGLAATLWLYRHRIRTLAPPRLPPDLKTAIALSDPPGWLPKFLTSAWKQGLRMGIYAARWLGVSDDRMRLWFSVRMLARSTGKLADLRSRFDAELGRTWQKRVESIRQIGLTRDENRFDLIDQVIKNGETRQEREAALEVLGQFNDVRMARLATEVIRVDGSGELSFDSSRGYGTLFALWSGDKPEVQVIVENQVAEILESFLHGERFAALVEVRTRSRVGRRELLEHLAASVQADARFQRLAETVLIKAFDQLALHERANYRAEDRESATELMHQLGDDAVQLGLFAQHNLSLLYSTARGEAMRRDFAGHETPPLILMAPVIGILFGGIGAAIGLVVTLGLYRGWIKKWSRQMPISPAPRPIGLFLRAA